METLGLLSLILGIALLVCFFNMASNIGSILKTLRNIELNSVYMRSSLEKIASQVPAPELKKSPDKIKELTREFDKGKPK